MFVWNMKLSFGERQPFRIWYQYLQTCLNDNDFKDKVNKNFYKDWHLNSVKTQKFDTWYKTHEHLFTDTNTTMKISSGVKSNSSILVEIPINYSVTKVQREIGKLLNDKLNQPLSKYRITSNRPLILPPFDYFLYAYKTKRDNSNFTLEEVWKKVDEHIKRRQAKVKKLVAQGKLRGRFLMGQVPYDKNARNKAVIINRNIKKAKNILTNVCKGVFPGNYSLD